MPQMIPLVLKDRGAPQVDHTFAPKNGGGADGVVTFVESTGIPLGDRRIAVTQVRSAGGRVRVSLKLTIPIVQDAVINGVSSPKVVKTNYADVQFNFDPASTTRERDDLVGFVNELTKWVDNTTMLKVLVDLEGLY
jgi:hypothetical protein